MSSTEIKFNKEQANYGIEQLKQCQKELYEADKLFYKGIMALASAKGMDLILREDAGINLYMPEKIVIECREEVATLIEEISSKIALVQDFNEEPKEGTETVQYRKAGDEIDKKIAIPMKPTPIEETVEAPSVQPMYGVPTPGGPIEGGTTGPIQALYAPPGIGPIEGGTTGPIQALYAPPGIGPIEGTPGVQPMYGVPTPGVIGPVDGPIQALYAPPGIGPIEGTPGVQPMYGVPTPGVIGPVDGPIQALYAPPGINPVVSPVVQPMYGVPTPGIVEPITGPIQALYAPPGIEPVVSPIVQPMYGVPTPGIVEPIPGPVQALYAPPGIDPYVGTPDPVIPTPAPVVPEYETIPDTGIPGVIEKNYVSKHPRLIGGLAATIGLFGIPTMLSDDFDEEEEKRINGKED